MATTSSAPVPVLNRGRASHLVSGRATVRAQRAPWPPSNGQPDESLTCHQPISMPMRPIRGRTCHTPHPGSPSSRQEIRTNLWSAGRSSIRSRIRRFSACSSARSGDRQPRLAQPLGQLVADDLELPQVKQPGMAGGHRRQGQPAHREGGHERVGELTLQPRDLLTQRPAGGPLVGPG